MLHSVRRILWALRFCFFLLGASYGLLMSRMPALSTQSHADEAAIGIAVLCLGAGSIGGFLAAPRLQSRLQTKTIFKAGSILLLCSLPVCGLTNSVTFFWVSFALSGFVYAITEVCANVQGILLEVRSRTLCLSSMYAAYSCGCLFGSLLASVCAFLGLSPLATFSSGALFLSCGRFFAVRYLLKDDKPRSQASETSPSHGIPGITILCGFLALCGYSVSGSSAEWSALLLHTVKGADEGTAALAFGCFAISLATGRLFGDRLRQRYGDFRPLLCGCLLSLAGQACFLLSPSPIPCLAGYAIAGFGFSPVIPIMMSRGAKRKDISPQKATAIISTLGNMGALVIPPAIGWLAGHFGLTLALLLPVTLTLIVMSCSPLFRKPA